VLAAERARRPHAPHPRAGGDVAAAAAPGRLVLTHFYPPVERVDVRALVATRWPGPVVLAHDGWSVELAPAGT
jgi:ribonuclease BN (tRNA processing enzyme)